jgi:predicted DNA-binding transcriptional regulator YafY
MSSDSPPDTLLEKTGRPTHQQLLALLRNGEALTQEEMTERLPIGSKRQARRLIKKLETAGVPLKERRRGHEKEYRLPPEAWEASARLDLTEREALALLLAAGAAESGLGPAPLKEALSGATNSLVESLPSSVATFEPSSLMEQLHFGEASSVEVDPEVFTGLVEALSNRRAIEMDYYSASSNRLYEGRKIDPWALAVRGDAWLCVAHDHRSGELRDFNLTRIQAIRPRDPESNGGDYQIPEDFDLELYFAGRFESLDGTEAYEVRLLVEPEVVPYFESKAYHRTQQIHEKRREDGRAVVSYEVMGLEEIASFVRSWGTSVKVLRPPELADRIAEEARRMAARYEEAAGP